MAATRAEVGDQGEMRVHRDPRLYILCSVTLIAMLGVGSISPALPSMMQALNLTPHEIGLLITAFTLPGMALAPVMGMLADRLGRKKTAVPSLLLFGIAGTGCFMVTDFDTLLVLRFLQGVGAGSLTALSNTMIGDIFHGRQRLSAMGIASAVSSLAAMGYPAVGGAVALVGWQYPFLLPLAAFPVAFMVVYAIDVPEPKTTQTLKEYLSGAYRGVLNPALLSLLFANMMMFCVIYSCSVLYLPILLRQGFDTSPLVIGLIISFSPLISAFVSASIGRFFGGFSRRRLVVLGLLFGALGYSLFPFVTVLWLMLGPAFVKGIAHGLFFPALNTELADRAPIDRRATFMSLNAMVFRCGQTIGPLFGGIAFAFGRFDAVFWGGAGLLVLAAFLVARCRA